MNDFEFKMGTALKFDFEREHDIITQLDSLASRKKLGEFVSNVIRIAFDNPEFLRSAGKSLADYGLTDERAEFFKNIDKDMAEMRNKVDKIFDMALKVYTLAQLGKRLGIEKRSSDLLQAQFLVQKQLDELGTILGIPVGGHIYESNKLDLVTLKAKDILEYILDSYDNVIAELKTGLTSAGPIMNEAAGRLENKGEGSSNTIVGTNARGTNIEKASGDTTKKEQSDNNNKRNKNKESGQNESSEVLITNEGNETKEDEIIDFGSNADWDALQNFIGS